MSILFKKRPAPTGTEGALDTISKGVFGIRALSFLCLFLLFTNIVTPILIVQLLREPVYIIDPAADGSVTITRAQRFRDALFFVKQSAGQAARAMFLRGPRGLDDTDTIDLMFNRAAKDKLDALLQSEQSVFTMYGYHQKPELGTVEVAADPNGSFRAKVTGQLVRTGTFNGMAKEDAVPFTLILSFFRNNDVALNQRYPLGIWDFDYQLQAR